MEHNTFFYNCYNIVIICLLIDYSISNGLRFYSGTSFPYGLSLDWKRKETIANNGIPQHKKGSSGV